MVQVILVMSDVWRPLQDTSIFLKEIHSDLKKKLLPPEHVFLLKGAVSFFLLIPTLENRKLRMGKRERGSAGVGPEWPPAPAPGDARGRGSGRPARLQERGFVSRGQQSTPLVGPCRLGGEAHQMEKWNWPYATCFWDFLELLVGMRVWLDRHHVDQVRGVVVDSSWVWMGARYGLSQCCQTEIACESHRLF